MFNFKALFVYTLVIGFIAYDQLQTALTAIGV